MPELESASLWGSVAAFVQLLIVTCVILRVVLTRHPPGSSFAWILITTLLPYFGFVLYLFFGERPIGQIRARRYRELLANWKTIAQHKLTPTGPLPPWLARHRTLIHLAVRMAHLPVTFGSSLSLLSETDEIFDRLLTDIRQAKHSISMEFYIWSDGGYVAQVTDELIQACQRGVRVRILLDDFGSRDFLRGSDAMRMRTAGIEILSAMPLRFLWFFGFQRVDLRLHRKTVIIDSRIGYTGSLNMIDPYSYDAAKTVGAWVDAMVRIEGPAVTSLETTFLSDWALQPDGDLSDLEEVVDSQLIPQQASATVITVPSGPYGSTDTNLHLLLSAINDAQFTLTLTTPYFVPNEVLATALVNAARRGVCVTLIIPEKADSKAVTYAARRYFDDMLSAGIRILLYKGGLLHTKSLAVDDEFALFGTVNFDNRSLHLNFEMMLLIFDSDFLQTLKTLHARYTDKCSVVELKHWKDRSVSERLREGLCYLISPLL